MANMQAFFEELADVVRYHRKKSGLSQLKLAKFAGVNKSVVFNLEQGKVTMQLDKLFSVFEVLNIQCELTSPLMAAYRKGEA